MIMIDVNCAWLPIDDLTIGDIEIALRMSSVQKKEKECSTRCYAINGPFKE